MTTAVPPFSYRGWAITFSDGRWHGRREGEHVTEATYIGLLVLLAETPLLLRHYLYLLAIGKHFEIAPEKAHVLPFVPRQDVSA